MLKMARGIRLACMFVLACVIHACMYFSMMLRVICRLAWHVCIIIVYIKIKWHQTINIQNARSFSIKYTHTHICTWACSSWGTDAKTSHNTAISLSSRIVILNCYFQEKWPPWWRNTHWWVSLQKAVQLESGHTMMDCHPTTFHQCPPQRAQITAR